MEECNGTEFERTANVFDMMYVPDDTEFDIDESRDEATEEVKGYKGNDFVTDVSDLDCALCRESSLPYTRLFGIPKSS